VSAFNPMPTAWFQSINPLAIFLLAPLFAWLWTTLPRRGINLSIPAKVAIGVFLQGVAFALMIWAVGFENRPTAAPLQTLPARVELAADGRVMFFDAPDVSVDLSTHYGQARRQVVHGGRLLFEPSGELRATGVLSDTDRDRMLRATAPHDFIRAVQDLSAKAADAAREAGRGASFEVSVTLDPVPPGFDIRYAGMSADKLRFDPETATLTTTVTLADKDYKQVLVCAADPDFRDALNRIYVDSARYKLGVARLFWFYILCTLGELCLSPVGLSMVSKLAPARFATMLMGMWLLTSFFGNFLAGFAGENWSAYHPYHYFGLITAVMFAASIAAFLLVRKVTAMMHGVR
jgi:POT family proton-dependent oligopeptide transporter